MSITLGRPPAEFGPTPFWFWNDRLDPLEITRQLRDFHAHGVGGVVIHPRVGLPRDHGWMSPPLLSAIDTACDEAARLGMHVVLYDEGMYPSGSANGRVVAENPAWACRGMVARPAGTLHPGETRVGTARGGTVWIVDRPLASVIRGLHYTDETTAAEDTPPAGDLLNPDATAAFIRHSYDAYHAALARHFGRTIIGIFTDEPSLLGRLIEPPAGVMPGTTGMLEHANRLAGVDFAPHLGALFFDDEPDAALWRQRWWRAVHLRLEETYYAPLAGWCRDHGVMLMGHPEKPDDLGAMRFFDVPGQDMVWRWVLPGETSLHGPQSTQAKAASSVAQHLGRRRNSNEFAGAYGHQLTFAELKWLADWCIVRGQNWLIPHAFYYSTRGPRRDERPPDVGPNSPWWDRFAQLADYWRRLCWLNTDSQHVCDVGVLAESDRAPWACCATLYERQTDFNYVLPGDGGYRFIVADAGWDPPPGAIRADTPGWEAALPREDLGNPGTGIRVRRVRKAGRSWLIVFNEASAPADITPPPSATDVYDPWTDASAPAAPFTLAGGGLRVLVG